MDWLTNEFENGIPLKFLYFWGHTPNPNQEIGNSCFSQWFECSFEINGILYKTAEHWMMSQKALLFENFDIYQLIIECDKPGEAKELGRQVKGFDEQIWIDNRSEIVRIGSINKFCQNSDIGEYLLNTGKRVLVEASPVDTIWGIGLSKDSQDISNIYAWRGLNLLGFALMEAREFLNEFGFFHASKFHSRTPWNRYPEKSSADLFWRMGAGEEFILNFSKEYQNMSEADQVIFRISNPEPKNWKGFYEN
jgi:ribA/ribD-fused uncharacterized protein